MTKPLLFLIPARGGSQGLPKKNIKSLAGKPLIVWTIDAALKSDAKARVVVTTDCTEIADVAREFGAEVPFMRPSELATDESSSMDVALHALSILDKKDNFSPEYLVLLQPTSPLRTCGDINAAISLARERRADAVVGVTPVAAHPYLIKRIDSTGFLSDFFVPDSPATRRQDLPSAYGINGAIYIIRPSTLREQRTWLPANTYAFEMPPERAIDIDTSWDFDLAELVLNSRAAQKD